MTDASTPAPRRRGPYTRRDERWHLDKKVPLGIILALMLQSAGILIWAVKLDARVEALEIASLSSRQYEGRIISLEVTLRTTNDLLRRVETKLDELERDRR